MGRWRKFLVEPLPWFLLVGFVLFLVDGWSGVADERNTTIQITSGQVQSLVDKWLLQMGREPSEDELAALIEDRIKEEVLYREAIRLGLDQDDTIIRRRLAQKMTFVVEDTLVDANPGADVLETYFSENLENYRIAEQFSFSHVFFSNSTGDALKRASDGLDRLNESADPNRLGDPFMLRKSYSQRTLAEIARLFGASFAQGLSALSTVGWQGPIESSYGFHLVRVEQRSEVRDPALSEVLDEVRSDYISMQARRQNESQYLQMRSNYKVIVPPL